jgi:20S proteasome alpha/beta subunit
MTIAIGAHCGEGVVVCADTKIVADDGVTTYGSKMAGIPMSGRVAFCAANAASDARAATMIVHSIFGAWCKLKTGEGNQSTFENLVKRLMTEWHSGYTQVSPPSLQFLLGAAFNGHAWLYFCEPPNTVMHSNRPITIGSGGRAIDPLLESVIGRGASLKQILMRIAYLMYKAKTDQAKDCGGDTDGYFVSKDGRLLMINREDMKAAEAAVPHIERIVDDVRLHLLSQEDQESRAKFLSGISVLYQAQAEAMADIEFPGVSKYYELLK